MGGVSVQEINRLELELLRLLDYRLHVPWEELRCMLKQLLAGSLSIGQGEVRGGRAGRRDGGRWEGRLQGKAVVEHTVLHLFSDGVS